MNNTLVITDELYNRLLEAYRETPGNYTKAAKAAGCGFKMARSMWLRGGAHQGIAYSWAHPICQVLESEQEEARVAAAEREVEERETLREQGRQEAVKARTEEVKSLHFARGNATAALAVVGRLVMGAVKLADAVKDQLIIDATNKNLDVGKTIRVLESIAKIHKQCTDANHRVLQTGHLIAGKPTDILGLADEPAENLTAAEVEEQMRLANEAFATFKLRSIQGGKQQEAPKTGTDDASASS
jgi:hypothetical protein